MMFIKELILIKEILQNSVIFVTYWFFFNKGFRFNQMSVIDHIIY